MQPLVTVDEMRWCDETTISRIGIPALILMENAGKGVAQFIQERFGSVDGRTIIVVCGKGNNAGDGFVAARHLHSDGAIVHVMLVALPNQLKGVAKSNFEILRRIAKKSSESLQLTRFNKKVCKPFLIVDALFGTGFVGRPTKPYSDAIEWINRQRVPVVSVDIPSGVNGTTGFAEGPAVRATATVTLGLQKTGLLCNDARDLVGEIHVIDIGIPQSVVERGGFKTFLVEPSDVQSLLPKRPSTAHKYSVGKVFIIAGSKGYTGAAALCATAALRSGAGAVVLATPEAVYPILARKLSEVIVEPVASTDEGSIAKAAMEKLTDRIRWADVVVVGPGLSRNSETQQLLRELLLNNKSRMLVDADGLFAVAQVGTSLLKKSKGEFILTPHSGEMSRLNKMTAKEIEKKRIESARSFAQASNQTLVLKGAPTVTAGRSGIAYVNSSGNPGMATVGSGDVLAGIIASLWAQDLSSEDAALGGVFLHGLSGDIVARKIGEMSLVAHDLIDHLPAAFRQLGGGVGR